MTISALKLISAKRSYTQQPIQQRRSKLSKRIWEQIELAKAPENASVPVTGTIVPTLGFYFTA